MHFVLGFLQHQARLDKLATVGLPMWVTEYTFETEDEKQRADWMEEGLTAFFAHPSVHGVIFWGFWDHEMYGPSGALVNGNGYHVRIFFFPVSDVFMLVDSC